MSAAFPIRPNRRPAGVLLLAGLLALALRLPAAPASAPLTTAAQVRALTVEQAHLAVPVHLRGVFLGAADPEGIAFVIQDETEAIYVQGPPDLVAGLGRGDLLEIEGVTDPGGFAPYVVAASLRRIGHGAIPEPLSVTLDELNTGQLDAKWIEISGVVRSIERKGPTDLGRPPPGTRYAARPEEADRPGDAKVKLKLAAGGARVVVEVRGALNPETYIDAEVRLRGLCFNLHNRNRQFVGPFVQVPRGVEVTVVHPAPEKPFDDTPRPVASLLRFEHLSGKPGHRVHVRGVVLHHQPGVALWVRDAEAQSLRVETLQNETLQPGDEVDVAGFPARGEYSAVLEDAVFRRSAAGGPPAPHAVADLSDALRRDADLVQLDARLVELRQFPDSLALLLDWRGHPVRAKLMRPEEVPPPPDWQPGSVVRVAGVCSIPTDEIRPLGGLWEPRSFQLLLRSPADLAILQPPPWWNAERIVWVLAGFLALAMTAVGLLMLASRRRQADQEHRRAMAETEFTAILSERNRVAREIHDTLSQNLGAISMQLELVRTHAAEISTAARHHLGLAHKLARAALAEARDSIWNMRSQVLEKGDLADALEGILHQMTEETGVLPEMRVEGARRRLPTVIENNLLRIGQEAITNAAKHARPHRIRVELTFAGRSVRLVVEDDGVGFDAEAPPTGDRRSFGLVGIRERVELLGGQVTIRSSPGQGATLVATVST